MTFTEAAIEVLRREGKPLHFKKIAEIAIRENLLDHVGKIPEETMADQLGAHCRLPRAERRVVPVQQGTFALAEWGLEEDPAGLDALVEPPEEIELLYRGKERHPVPSRDLARSTGRSDGRGRRREDEERRGRRFPPPAEVAYEILAGAGRPLGLLEIAAQGAERLLMPDAFVRDIASLQAALSEDNRRRESSGRKPLFQIDGETVTLGAQPEPGERVAAPVPSRGPTTLAEMRRVALGALRRRMRECDGPTVEHVAGRLLEKLGFRDLKVAKRGREHVVYTARRRMGLGDVRHAVRILRSGADAVRRDVADLRRDLTHYGAQIGVVITAGEGAREARGEAGAAGQLPIVLLCGEALAEALAEAGVGCVTVILPDVDEAFFAAAEEAAEKEEAARRARREERERREGPRREPKPEPPAPAPEGATREAPAVAAEGTTPPAAATEASAEAGAAQPLALATGAGADEDDEDEGPEGDEADEADVGEGAAPATATGAPAEPGAAGGERRRRRRRRRRRGGRGRGREGAPSAEAQPGGGGAPRPDAEGGPPQPGPEPGPAAAPASAPSEPPAGQTPGGEGGSGS